eukprot:4629047-Pyramimonas_sp.AAC.1
MRAFSDIHQTSKFRGKLSTWQTASGGFGGIPSSPKTVATPSDHQDGWNIFPVYDENHWQPYEEGSVLARETPTMEDPGLTPDAA